MLKVRDAGGRITRKEESLDGGAVVDTYYKYPAGCLNRVCDDEPCSSIRAEYTYDPNSNRTGGFDGGGGAISATYDTQDWQRRFLNGMRKRRTRFSLADLKGSDGHVG